MSAAPVVDPRGPRFAAAVTAAVLAVVLVTGSGGCSPRRPSCSRSAPVRGSQQRRTRGCSAGSSGRGFRPPVESRTPRPPRFAQGVGLGFAVVGLVGGLPSAATPAAARSPRPRAGGRVPQRGVRPVPRLRGLPVDPPLCPGPRPHPHARLPLEDPPHEQRPTPSWSTPTGSRHISTTRRSSWSRSTRTPRAYDKGHIRGAVRIDWKADLQDPVRRDFVGKAQFEALLSAQGIANDDTVVLYGGNNNWFAAYAYWYFKLYGHARRPAARRRPQEVGARLARAGRPTCRSRAGDDVHRQGRRTPRSAPSATTWPARSAR